ncbi:penicillin acylase family protein [Lacisediminimonas sp.]|uniref:penicillin acylase family protein n=1 Tax=Lacisediminimonas sp. TaxID=3060582 RepID=UPI00351D3058
MNNRWIKICCAVLFLVVGFLFAVFWYRTATLPQTAGALRVPGLQHSVDVVRDAEGVPHVFAASARDAWFALGYLHAQDRLWQLEMNRRIASGRVAEILGPGALGTDRFLRTLGISRNAQQIWQRLAPDTRGVLTAYAEGINAWLLHDGAQLPPEFLLTGAPRPAPWQAVDSIAWQTMMAWDLGANWTQEILRMRLAQRLSVEQINAFLPPYPGDAPLPTRDYTSLYRSMQADVGQLVRLAQLAPPSGVDGVGSNNWVVSGQHTKSGKPLLANDPHLGLNAPALWYFAHLSAPGLDVIGATLPGLPGVVLGRNQRIAWGFTNTAPDVQDLYLERVNPANAAQYQTPDGWADFGTRQEVIRVKGQPDVTMTVRETRHGPVITGALPLLERSGVDAAKHVVAFAWTALMPDDLTIQGGIRLGSAGNWDEFITAARDFHSPQQNMVYADVDGNIGFIAPGRVPRRLPGNDLHGLAPAPGWDARYDWAGFIPFDQLPRSFNPPSGKIASANEKIVAPGYPYFLTSEWSLPYRAQRIAALLDATGRHDLDSFARIQKDVLSLAAAELLPLVRRTRPVDERSREALALLAGWRGEMLADRPEPLIFNAWMRELARRIFQDELGDALIKDYFEQRNVHAAMVNVLQDRDGQSTWCRDTRPGAAATDCAQLMSVSLGAALAGLEQQYGGNMRDWRWGRAHLARAEHRPFSRVPLLAPLFELRVPTPGDTYTVNVGRYNLSDETHPFHNRHAASLRALYDLSDLEKSRYIHSTGQSGNALSAHYRSFVQRWARAEYLPMTMQRSVVEQGSTGTLRMSP